MSLPRLPKEARKRIKVVAGLSEELRENVSKLNGDQSELLEQSPIDQLENLKVPTTSGEIFKFAESKRALLADVAPWAEQLVALTERRHELLKGVLAEVEKFARSAGTDFATKCEAAANHLVEQHGFPPYYAEKWASSDPEVTAACGTRDEAADAYRELQPAVRDSSKFVAEMKAWFQALLRAVANYS